jgi:hypothetical protein
MNEAQKPPYPARHSCIIALTALALGWSGAAEAALFSVNYVSQSGLRFSGTVNSTTDQLSITRYDVEKPPGPTSHQFFGLNESALAVVNGVSRFSFSAMRLEDYADLYAAPGQLTPNHDIPDDWDGSMGTGASGGAWIFVSNPVTSELPWEMPAGLSIDTSTNHRMTWGGDTNGTPWTAKDVGRVPFGYPKPDGSLEVSYSDHYEFMDCGALNVGSISINVQPVPEPGWVLLSVVGFMGVLRQRSGCPHGASPKRRPTAA